MINKVSSNKSNFKDVNFNSTFNIILADRTSNSTKKDSRNGLGKSLLIDIIHFALGSSPTKNQDLHATHLSGWVFDIDLKIFSRNYTIQRSVKFNKRIFISGELEYLPIKPIFDSGAKKYYFDLKTWNIILGKAYFDLSINNTSNHKYNPSFRTLMSYFARRGFSGFADPFKNRNSQKPVEIQISNTYLLNFHWEYASEFQILKDRESVIKNLATATKVGYLDQFMGTVAELNTEKVRLLEQIQKLEADLTNFIVHPEYEKINKEANLIHSKIQSKRNELTVSQKLLDKYISVTHVEGKDENIYDVEKVYKELGIYFNDKLSKTLDEVLLFHKRMIENRKEYLKTEITKLENYNHTLNSEIQQSEMKKSELMRIINSHSALDEHTQMEKRLAALKQKYESVVMKLDNLEKIKKEKSNITVERETLIQKATTDLKEREEFRDMAIKIFNTNSQYLYEEPGNLLLDIGKNGYKFDIDIKRAQSQGVNLMKVFCYDLTIAELRRNFNLSVPPLIHDSTIFSDVDERQVARALELAARKSQELGFQYICTLNSDNLPMNDLSEEFKNQLESDFLRLRLTDEQADGCLLGIRF